MKSINAQLLKKMYLSASNNLYNHYPEIDALNVFPVPDGDTGLNMNATLSSGVKEIQFRDDQNVYDLSVAFAEGLFFGARGNSGAILSQIFKGFTNALKDKKTIDIDTLVSALSSAKEFAYKAVIKPVEGTILTVIREISEYVKDNSDTFNNSMETAFNKILKEAKKSLNHTPELLPVLKEVGVVDSGGAGLVTILEGMNSAINNKFVEKKNYEQEALKNTEVTGSLKQEEFGYCTELIMELGPENIKKPFVENKYLNTLSMHGNSLVFVKNENMVKVHIHTMSPGWVLNYSQQFGEFKKLKIENMTEQHNELLLLEQEKNDLNIKLNSSSNIVINLDEKKEPKKEFGIIATCSGEGIADMFKEIGVDEIVSGGQTMNPSTEDFVNAINKLNAKHIFILPNNSNIIMAANQAAEIQKKVAKIKVIPSTTIPEGLVAAMTLNPDLSFNDNFKELKKALKTVKTTMITYAIKDSEINGVKVKKDDFLAIQNKNIIYTNKDKFEVLYKTLEKIIDKDASIITVFTGEDITKEQREEIEEKINKKYGDSIGVEVRDGQQPVYSFIIGIE